MPTHQARTKRQEVPFGARCLQHFQCINAKPVEYQRQFVDERDVDITLGIFNDFSRFGNTDAAGFVGAGDDNALVELIDKLSDFRCGAVIVGTPR